jgi:acyl carrier protein
MKKEKVVGIIEKILIDEFELDKDQVKPEALLKEDLEIESLDFVDIAVIIEKEFGVKIKGEQLVNVLTLKDFYEFVYDKVNAD